MEEIGKTEAGQAPGEGAAGAPEVPRKEDLRPGASFAGFVLRSVTPLHEQDETAWLFVHERTGLQWLHFEADDPVSSCAIAVTTPVTDDRGLPHIVEHLVFEGSKRHPGVDFLRAMMDRTVCEDLNGTTSPFMTRFYFSSAVESDMEALFRVFFDAVLDPEMSDEAFRREAGRFRPADPADPSGPLEFTGVVFNEMRAKSPNPFVRMLKQAVPALMPDVPAGFTSGGMPADVMTLSLEDARAYHRRWYCPANMRICSRGEVLPFALLRDADRRLDGVEPGEAAPPILPQPRRPGIRQIELGMEVLRKRPPDEPPPRRFVRLWLVPGPGCDDEQVEAWRLFDDVFEFDRVFGQVDEDGDPAPCEAGCLHEFSEMEGPNAYWGFIGESPFDDDEFEEWFRDRLDGFLDDPETAAAVRETALKTSKRWVSDINDGVGLGEEARSKGFRGVFVDWILRGDPFLHRRSSASLGLLHRFRRDPEAALAIARDLLLGHPHRLDVALHDVPDEGDPEEAAIQSATRELREALSDEQCALLAKCEAALAAMPPGDAAGLPETDLSGIPAGRFSFRSEAGEDPVSRTTFVEVEEDPRGEAWMVAFADLRDFTSERLLFLPHVLDSVRRGLEDSGEGTIDFQPVFYTNVLTGARVHGIEIKAPLYYDRIDRTISQLSELFRLRDPLPFDRANRMVRRWAARKRSLDEWSQSYMSRNVWATRPTAEASLSAACNNLFALNHLVGYRTATVRPDAAPEPALACARLAGEFVREASETADLLHNPARWTFATIGPRHIVLPFRQKLRALLRSAPSCPIGLAAEQKFAARTEAEGSHEAETNGKEGTSTIRISIPAPADSLPEKRLLEIGAGLVDRDIAFRRIRREIGAYVVRFGWEDNAFELESERNPDIAATLATLDGLEGDVEAADWTPEDVRRASLRVARRYLTRPAPLRTVEQALFRHLSGATPERIKEELESLQDLEPDRIKRTLLRALRSGLRIASVHVKASEEAIKEANRQLPPEKQLVLSEGIDFD